MTTSRLKVGADEMPLQVQRFATNPLITSASSPTLGENINGPSVIRVPSWLHPNRLLNTRKGNRYSEAA